MRFLPALLVVFVAGTAYAQVDAIKMDLVKPGTDTLYTDLELQELFNDANCRCSASQFGVDMTQKAQANVKTSDVLQIWVGLRCNETMDRDTRCVKISMDKTIAAFENGSKKVEVDIPISKLMFPTSSTCTTGNGPGRVWVLVDSNSDEMYEITSSKEIAWDTTPPPSVTELKASPGEGAITVSWKLPTAVEDTKYFQVLCASSLDRKPILVKPPSDPEYRRVTDIKGCESGGTTTTPDAGPSGTDGGTPDAGTTQTGDKFNALDPSYICSERVSATGSSVRIDLSDPENVYPFGENEKILTKLVAVDEARNSFVIDGPTGGSDLPSDVRDAWEVYKDRGGSADGGFCFVATAVYGDYDHPYVRVLRTFRDETLAKTGPGRAFIAWYYRHSPPWADFLRAHPVWRGLAAVALFPVVALAWLWNAIGLAGLLLAALLIVAWRRRRRVATAAATALALLALVRPAGAQVYLEEGTVEETGLPASSWAFELKLGPYYPDVDGEDGLTGKPYAETFGDGNSLMFQVELDRFFFHPAGELGLGASIGYMGNSAKAFTQDASGGATTTRSADDTAFKMLPLSLVAVYRFTMLADRTVVPVVPYGKLGLSYYIWQITKGDGGLAQVTGGDKARGGTLGWQGTLGLAVRVDAFDSGAARSLEGELGVEHASFFAEATYAAVSGLGQSNKLHLGDLTWAAGINFEF